MNAIDLITSAIGWSLLHSIWQIALIGLFVRFLLAVFRNVPAYKKHLIMLAGLFVIFLSFAGTTGLYILKEKPIEAKVFEYPQELISSSLVSDKHVEGTHVDKLSIQDRVLSFLTGNIRLITGIWFMGFLVFLVRFTGSALYLQRLRTKYAYELEEKWQAMGDRIRHSLILKRTIRILESDLIRVPITTGVLRPVIILPLGLVTHIPFNQLEAVMVHEMAHIKRYDYLINLFRSFLEALFFYHPVFWWLSGKLETYREHACDDITIDQCGSSEPLQKALLDLSSCPTKRVDPAAAFFNHTNQLLNRIKRMKTNQNNPKKRGNLAGFLLFPAVVLTLAIASAFAPRISVYPETTKATNPPLEIRSGTPVIPPNLTVQENVGTQPASKNLANENPVSTPDTTQKTIGIKAKTEEGYILLEFDEDMNIQKITKNGNELQGEEKEKYQRLADKTKKVFKEEEKMKARQRELEALEHQLQEVQKRMQEVQDEYHELWQSYREKSELNGHFPLPEVYADVFSAVPVPPSSFEVHPFYGDVPKPIDSIFHFYKDFDVEPEFDPEDFDDRMKRSMKLYEDAMRKQKQAHEQRVQEYVLQQEKHYNKAKQYRLQQELYHVFEEKVRSELLQDELIDAWDDLESFELTEDHLNVDGKKQSKRLHRKYMDLYESVMDKPLEGKIEIH